MLSQLNNNEFVNEIRCLRSSLGLVLNQHSLGVLEEAERRINGSVSTHPATLSPRKPQQGHRVSKKQRVDYYLQKFL